MSQLRIPNWAVHMDVNYRGNIILLSENEEQRTEVVVEDDGRMYYL